jgi:ABC-type multidrug transport system ATPase subunit
MPAWRSKVTLLAQDAPIAQGSIADNLELAFGLAAGKGRRIDTERRARLMAEVGLDRIPGDRKASSLSGGERHRLALVRGLLWDPPVLVADEPLSGLDPERAEICFRLLQQQARREDRAVLCVLHDPARRQDADRLLVLTRNGIEARS